MKGKAVMLVANRTLSALVVVCLVVSAFAGLLGITGSTPRNAQAASLGDLTISSGTYTIQNIEQPVDGNVTVTGTGNLTIRDATLSVISNFDVTQRHTITVQGNGVIYLEHGVITTYLDQINPWPFLNLVVQAGGHLIATGQSVLMFPGNITLASGAHVILRDTQILKLPDVNEFVVGTSGRVTLDSADDGPALSVTDSTLELYDSKIPDLPVYGNQTEYLKGPATNISLAGSSVMLAVNSYVGIDFGPITYVGSVGDWTRHNSLLISGTSHAYLYGTSFEHYGGYLSDRVPAIISSGAAASLAVPQSKGAADNTGQSLASLASVDTNTYQVSPGQTMEIETFNTGAVSDATVLRSARLVVTYSVSPTYAGTNSIQWAKEGTGYASTNIVPRASDPSGTTASFSLPIASVPTVGDVRNLDVLFSNNGGVGSVQIDQLAVVFGFGGDAYIYRWLNVTIGDAYGVPIPSATVTAKFTGATSLEGQDSVYYTPTGVSTSPPVEVLNYLGENATSFRLTKADGNVAIPYLTDVISNEGSTTSSYVGSYAITGAANIGGIHSSTESYSFPAYPAMDMADRYFDVTVEITGVSEPSPDQARWLVVPVTPTQTSLTIEGMTYYHAGDVIVAASGTLTFDNTVFELVQAYPNQRTVYVDGTQAQPGKLVFEKSRMNSNMGVNIVVKGYAILEVLNSTFSGVNITAMDHATVILRNASIDQEISTSWDSHARVDVKDSTLMMPIVLSGNSQGGFTNTSVPSIRVTDNAWAMVYRWIHVTVFDGAGKPLPNAVVSANYLITGDFAKSAVTSSDPLMRGVAQVNANGTNITSVQSTFVGNYKVSAYYLWGSAPPYWSDENISVGVLPYSTPLGKNATYATLKISSVLPHVFVNQAMGPIVATPSNPLKDELVSVAATVNNSGPAGAYNVKVSFSDNGLLFDTVYIPEIKPGNHSVATAHWLAPTPVNSAPTSHNISIRVDPGVASQTAPIGWTTVTVVPLPDLNVLSGITFATPYPENDTQTLIKVTVANDGDKGTNARVRFYDDGVRFYETNVSIPAYIQSLVEAPWIPTKISLHTITVTASTTDTEMEYGNNQASTTQLVYDHPDLVLRNIAFSAASVSGGSVVTVTADLVNTGMVQIKHPKLRLDVTGPGVSILPLTSTLTDIADFNKDSLSKSVAASFTAPTLNRQTNVNVSLTINPDMSIVESSYSNNTVTDVIVVLDVRPDLSILPGEISIRLGGTNLTALSEQFGKPLNITADVQNLGGQPIINPGFRVDIGVRSTDAAHTVNYTLFNATNVPIWYTSTNHSKKVMRDWTITLTSPGLYEIWVYLDPKGTIDEPSKANNFAVKSFNLTQVSLSVVVLSAAGNEFKAGDLVTVSATFTYNGTSIPVKLLPGIRFWLVNHVTGDLVPGSNSTVWSTDSDGQIITQLRVPSGTRSGDYYIRADVPDSGGPYDSAASIHVSAVKKASLLPTWAWIAIIVGAVGVVLGFLGWTYKYGLGKLVECGECGAFIPAASKRCPKCGVEFEVGTMKCSECGAWIPAESTECPNCGVKFVGETEDDTDYLERMKREYDEMTSKYRELAKGELGKKFSDRDFEDWYKRQPGYISFDDWLAKEEEKKLEGPVPCKVCGTLNPKEATVCHKCGTVFTKEEPPKKGQPPQAGEPPKEEAAAEPSASQAQPQPVAPRMVIRRPIDRKVVPKKIIKSPLGGETEEQQQQ